MNSPISVTDIQVGTQKHFFFDISSIGAVIQEKTKELLIL